MTTPIGHKIRDIRRLKGLTQENMATMLEMTDLAYRKMERNETKITLERLEQIADKLCVSATDIMTFGDRVSNFFDQSSQATGINNLGGYQTNNHYDQRELVFTIEKQKLELDKLKAEKEKAEFEARYWKEKFGA